MIKHFLVCCFCIVAALTSAAEEDSWQKLQKTAKKHLVQLIGIDTSSPNPEEIKAARYIYKDLNKHKIDWDIYIPAPNRANLVARLKGTDPTQKPLLLISHLDTVAAGSDWTLNPFKATQKNGNIYGLGATDAKNYTAIYLALLTWLKDNAPAPQRDIIFMATSGEETGSHTGLLWLTDEKWATLNPGYALNEGGGIIRDLQGADIVFAEAATKMYMDIKVTAYGTAGHSSIPDGESAVYSLSQALAKIAAYNPPSQLTPTAKVFFQALEPLQDTDGKTTLHLLLEGTPQEQQAAGEVISLDPFFQTQLKDTLNPTVLAASHDTSATSGEASAIINVRLLPDSNPDKLLENLQQLFTPEEGIVLEILERPQLPFPRPMDGTDPLFASIKTTAQKLWPGSITVPGISPASGDNEFLRRKGVITYGLGPEMDPTVQNTTHAANEFISEHDFFNQLKFVAGIVFDFAYQRDLLPLTVPTTVTPTQEEPKK